MSRPDASKIPLPVSDSENDRTYVDGAPASASGYSRPSSISINHRREVTKVAPAGCRCVITLRQSNLECAHILRRATSLEHRKILAFCWGIKLEELNLDAPENMMWLTPDMHRSFDKNQWALVPPLEILSDIQTKLLLEERETFTEMYPPKRDWKYTFVQLVPCPDTITREDTVPPTIHHSPYQTLPIVTSHVHPYYTICNVAQKDRKHYKEFNRTTSGRYGTISNQSDLPQRIQTCRVIYDTWMRKNPDLPVYLAPPSQSSRSTCSGASGQRDSNRRAERSMRRARTANKSNPGPALHEQGKPEPDDEDQDSDVTDPMSLPESQTVADEVHVYDSYHSLAAVPFQSKVGQWLVEQDNFTNHGEPSMVEGSLGLLQHTQSSLLSY